jgi:hypothetical protein
VLWIFCRYLLKYSRFYQSAGCASLSVQLHFLTHSNQCSLLGFLYTTRFLFCKLYYFFSFFFLPLSFITTPILLIYALFLVFFFVSFYPFCSWRLLSRPYLMASHLLAVITQSTLSSCTPTHARTHTLPNEASSFFLLPLHFFCGFELKKSPEFSSTTLLKL